MTTRVSQVKGSPAKLRLDVGKSLVTPLQGPKSASTKVPVKMLNAEEWCKAEIERYAD